MAAVPRAMMSKNVRGSIKMNWFKVDSQGRESRTFLIVSLSWLALWVRFTFAGLHLPFNLGTLPPMTATEFGTALALVLAPWLTREWIKK
jgi:hypothetical protein